MGLKINILIHKLYLKHLILWNLYYISCFQSQLPGTTYAYQMWRLTKPHMRTKKRPPDRKALSRNKIVPVNSATSGKVINAVVIMVLTVALVCVVESLVPDTQSKEPSRIFGDVAKMAISGLLGFLAGRR